VEILGWTTQLGCDLSVPYMTHWFDMKPGLADDGNLASIPERACQPSMLAFVLHSPVWDY